MSMFASKLWSMLSVRSPGVIVTARGYGTLSTDDLRAMLQDLPRGPFLMGMVHEAGDTSSFWDLERYLWVEINGLGARRRWTWPGKTRDRKLADLVLMELFFGKCCPVCTGKGLTQMGPNDEQCDTCYGNGVVSLTQMDRAEFVGLGKSEWHRVWARRYITCQTLADDWLEEARRHLAVRVRRFRDVA